MTAGFLIFMMISPLISTNQIAISDPDLLSTRRSDEKRPDMDNDDRYTENQLSEGEALMRKTQRQLKRSFGLTGEVPPGVSADDFRHTVCAANLRALIVMPKGDGWVADILLHKSLPNNGGDIIGTA